MSNRTLGDWFISLATHGSSMASDRRRRVYLLVLGAALAALWIPVLAFITLKPTSYESEWSLVLPVAGSGHAVQLESVGQASLPSTSPYANTVVDPRVNYKAIATSYPVLAAAAKQLGMTPEAFGKPRVKLVDQTAVMGFRISGRSADEAQAKAQALYDALEAELTRLRTDELNQREQNAAAALSSFSQKLADAQKQIVDFQAKARITSLEQFRDLTLGIERSREQRQALESRRKGIIARVANIERGLGIPTGKAGAVLALQNDAEFLKLQEAGAAASAELSDYEARLGEKHFKLVSAREADAQLRKAQRQRAARIGSGSVDPERLVMLASSGNTRLLVQELVELHGELASVDAEIKALDTHLDELEARINAGAGDAVALEDLQRKEQVAMAVFTTALAKLDLGKTDTFSSYPMLQTLMAPTRPERSDTLATKLALLGAFVGSLFCLTGLIVLWIRKPYLQRIFQSA